METDEKAQSAEASQVEVKVTMKSTDAVQRKFQRHIDHVADRKWLVDAHSECFDTVTSYRD